VRFLTSGKRIALTRSLALTLLAAGSLAPAGAAAAKAPSGTATLATLAPLSGQGDFGTVHLFARPKQGSMVQAGVIGGDGTARFTLALSTKSCFRIDNDPSNPGYIGETEKNLFDAKPIKGSYFDDIVIGGVARENVRAARSLVLLGAGKGGELEPRACGSTRTYSLTRTSFKPRRRSVLVALLLPFSEQTARLNLQLTAGRGPDSLALTGDFNPDEAIAYSLRLSSRSCAEVQQNPTRPGFIGPPLIRPIQYSGTTFDNESAVDASTANARAAKSIVLVGRGAGGGKFRPRACGRAYKMTDVLISR
jgi:hypothetical protein